MSFLLTVVSAAIIIPIILTVIITQTTIAERIIDTLYFDDSAKVRATQWEVFRYLSLSNWLFGISHDDLNILKYQIGLGGKETDIENFWALMLLNLGAIGFTVFVGAFGGFLWHLGRYSRDLNGWLLVITALIIDSGSNSLGVKSSDLFIEVGFVVAMSGYADYLRVKSRAARPRLQLRPFASPQIALRFEPGARIRGLRTMASRSA